MITQQLTFLGLESFWWGALLVLGCLIAVGLVVKIYRYERQLVSPPVGWSLLGLRCSLLFVLLLMALQPTLTWTNERKEQTRVLIALDVSESMDRIDEHASREERLQWAVGLGMIRPEMLEAEPSAGQAGESEAEAPGEGGAAPVLPEPAQGGLLSRFELARQLLSVPKNGLLARLKNVANTELLLFSRHVREIVSEDLTGSRQTLSETLLPEVTSYTELLQAAAARENCTAIVLLTDGVATSADQPIEAAKNLAGQSRPIYSILTGSTLQPLDLAIESVDHPEMVYKQDQPLIRVRASTHGFENRPLTVTLTDVATGNRLTRDVVGGERFVDVEFDLPLNDPGRQRFIVDVQAAESSAEAEHRPVEVQQTNNQQEFAINVVDDTTRVLLVDGEGRWEFRFLESALERDERVELQAVLFEQPYLGLLPHSFFASSLPAGQTAAGPFENVDLIIWGDADPRGIEQKTWDQLEQFVAQQGGTLVISAGKRHFSGQMQNPVLSRMLPIQHYRPIEGASQSTNLSPQARGFHLELTSQGKNHPLMKLETDSLKNETAWGNLPGHLWGLAGVPKPGAVMLASATGTAPVASGSGPLGTIVLQNYGLGRVVWIGIDSTWRWRSRVGDRDHYRFWGQLTRWAAEMRSASGTDEVRFGLEDSAIETGEETVVRARWSRSVTENVGELKALVEVYPQTGAAEVPLMSFPLEALETQPLIHEAKVPPLPAGEYRLKLTAGQVPLGPEAIEAELLVVPRSNNENNRLAADRTLLEQLAALTSGAVLLPHQLDQLLERLHPDSLALQEKQDFPLWNHWLLFVVIMLLLGGEWLLRKWHGLP